MSADVATVSVGEAQRLTQRIKLTATTVRDNMRRLWDLVEEAKTANVHQVLGYASWTAYLADTLGEEPLRLSRDERQEVVAMLAGEGMSTRAIAPIVGAAQMTVVRDLAATETNDSPEPPTADPKPSWDLPAWADPGTGEVAVAPAVTTQVTTGLNGKEYKRSEPRTPNRRALTDSARDIGWDFRKVAERLKRLQEDDRFSRNREEVAAHLRGHLMFTVEVCQDLLDTFDQQKRN